MELFGQEKRGYRNIEKIFIDWRSGEATLSDEMRTNYNLTGITKLTLAPSEQGLTDIKFEDFEIDGNKAYLKFFRPKNIIVENGVMYIEKW